MNENTTSHCTHTFHTSLIHFFSFVTKIQEQEEEEEEKKKERKKKFFKNIKKKILIQKFIA